MPDAPPKACRVCGRKNCGKHIRKSWTPGAHVTPRIRGSQLQRIRRDKLTREPWCRECRKEGVFTIAAIVDHVVPLAEGGEETDTNRQPLCRPHSDAKTAEESKRGQARRRRS
jgi:5-methylcytosine-specific restriction protein A